MLPDARGKVTAFKKKYLLGLKEKKKNKDQKVKHRMRSLVHIRKDKLAKTLALILTA